MLHTPSICNSKKKSAARPLSRCKTVYILSSFTYLTNRFVAYISIFALCKFPVRSYSFLNGATRIRPFQPWLWIFISRARRLHTVQTSGGKITDKKNNKKNYTTFTSNDKIGKNNNKTISIRMPQQCLQRARSRIDNAIMLGATQPNGFGDTA